MSERHKQTIEAKLQRTFGMEPAQREVVEQQLNAATDWYRICKDGHKVMGTRAQVSKKCACEGHD